MLVACEAYNFYHHAVLLAVYTLSTVLKDDSDTLSKPKKYTNYYKNIKDNFLTSIYTKKINMSENIPVLVQHCPWADFYSV